MSSAHGAQQKGGSADEPFVPGEGDPAALSTVVTLVVGFALVFIIVLGLEALFAKTQEEEVARKTFGTATNEITLLRSTQRERLAGYRWVDKPRGVVAIPIERAMELVMSESRGDSLKAQAVGAR